MILGQLNKKLIAVLLLSGSSQLALANSVSDKLNFSIVEGSAPSAIRDFIRQTRLQVLFSPEDIDNRVTHSVAGVYAPSEALAVMLAGTGLGFDFVDAKTVVISSEKNQLAQRSTNGEKSSVTSSMVVFDGPDHATTETESSADEREQVGEKSRAEGKSNHQSQDDLDEVLITGTRISRNTKDGPQELKIYDKTQIEQSGQTTLSSFLNTLPEVSTAVAENNLQTALGQTTVRLRGLPLGTTLVLLNGRRLEDGGVSSNTAQGFFDLNNIPVSAIDRIEVLPGGASAIYGSSALAGVVNVVLKHDFDGVEVQGHFGKATATHDGSVSGAFGRRTDDSAFSVVASYFERAQLLGSDRKLTSNLDFTRYGGPDSRYTQCNPGNVSSLDGSNLPGLNSSFAAIPGGTITRPTISDFGSTAGTLNKCSATAADSIAPSAKRFGILASASHRISGDYEVFFEFMWSSIRSVLAEGSPQLFAYSYVVPASNPFNPFGTDVAVDYQFPSSGPQTQFNAESNFFRPLVGIRGKLGTSWNWEISTSLSQDNDRTDFNNYNVNYGSLAAALGSTNPASSLNVFSSNAPASASVIDSLFDPFTTRARGRSFLTTGLLRGPLFVLPAGTVQSAFGAEYEVDSFYDNIPGNTALNESRRNYAGFGEIRAPLVSDSRNSPARQIVVATAAARIDRSDDFGAHSTFQGGLEWRPVSQILVQGSYGQSYRAPALIAVHQPTQSFDNFIVVDPLTGQNVSTMLLYGGNPNLRPETGESKSVGIIWSNDPVPTLRAGATIWSVDQKNRIAQFGTQQFLEYENVFPGSVVRGPSGPDGAPGQIQELIQGYVNFGSLKVKGIDLDASFKKETVVGDLTLSVSATETYQYLASVTPTAPLENRLSNASADAFAPRWKGNTTLAWKRNNYSFGVTGRYVGRYLDYQDIPNSNELGNFWLMDAALHGEFGGGSKTYFDVGSTNLANKQPKYSNYGAGTIGYDPAEYDIVGRIVYINIGARW